MSSSISEFIIEGREGIEIRAAGMPDFDSLFLQRMNNYETPISEPLIFKRIATVEGERCLHFIEGKLYEATKYDVVNGCNYEIFDYQPYTLMNQKEKNPPERIFISHGRSKDWHELQNFLERDLKLNSLELSQEPNLGRTILQKLSDESKKCGYAIIVMTGDDQDSEGKPRARENVIHEIGFFQGIYGLDRVCILHEEGTTIPSNIFGVVYLPFKQNEIKSTFFDIQKELKGISLIK